MKISKLVEILKEIKENNGDIEVYISEKDKKEYKLENILLGIREGNLFVVYLGD